MRLLSGFLLFLAQLSTLGLILSLDLMYLLVAGLAYGAAQTCELWSKDEDTEAEVA